ncbi:unnamed protein product [Pieris macdunnoughi]|uniref:Mannosyltransferase n=1 Tax=Pieris macdunnoughi TaxID=345717 RepID=A0A821XZT9_9NEOP|nr:unnamed protein product [Pieris macdunnoughi]
MALVMGLGLHQVFSIILLLRVLSVFLVITWYVPDEYWQTLEVAHKQAFGYGALTWEWQKGIRSYLYPSIVSVFYSVLKFASLDYPEVVVVTPRILQAILSAFADYRFYKWTGGRKWALFLILTCWFWFYTASRTLLQTFETDLVAIALSVFPFKAGKLAYYEQEDNRWIWLAVLSVFVRPTSAPLWLVLGMYNLFTTNQGKFLFFKNYLPISLIAGGSLVALDTYMYGRLIITPWEFFKFNVLQDIGSFYGTHPWHWYLTQGIPAVLGVTLPLVLWGIVSVLRRHKENKTGVVLLTAAVVHLGIHSCIAHKEFRFVLPLLPVLLYLAQDVVVPWSRKAKRWQLYSLAAVILLGNAVPAAYFGSVHQAGTTRVMALLREAIPHNRSSVLFLMPCHSTPLYSHLHTNVSVRHLDCSPPPPGRTFEAEAFFNNPGAWWAKEYSARQPPTLLVMFDVLRGRVESLLENRYRPIGELPHTQFPSGEVGASVLVFERAEGAGRGRA